MPTDSYYYAAAQPLDASNNLWKTAVGGMLTDLISEAYNTNAGVAGKIVGFAVDVVTGALVNQTLNFTVSSTDGVTGTITFPDADPISIEEGLEAAAAIALGTLFTALLPADAAIVFAADAIANVLVSYVLGNPTVAGLIDFIAGTPKTTITLNSGGSVIAGGVLNEHIESNEVLSVAINGLIRAAHSGTPGFPAIEPGMTVNVGIKGISETIVVNSYTVYAGSFVQDAASAMGKVLTAADTDSFFKDGMVAGVATWRDTSVLNGSGQPTELEENRYIDHYTTAEISTDLAAPLVLARSQDILSIDMDSNPSTPRIDFSPVNFKTGTLVVAGDSANNLITGSSSGDGITGLGGSDFLIGKAGADVLNGGSGKDYAYGGSGGDQFIATANTATGLEGDSYFGGDDVDLVNYFEIDTPGTSGLGFAVDLTTGSAQYIGAPVGSVADRLDSIEDVHGSNYADYIIGDGAGNNLNGGGSADLIFGGDGTDVLVGGAGNDVMIGGRGTSQAIWGGAQDATADGSDGSDVYMVSMPSGLANATISLADRSVVTANTSWGETNTNLHSIESIVAEKYDAHNAITTTSSGLTGLHITGLDPSLMQLVLTLQFEDMAVFGAPNIETGVRIQLGGQTVGDFYNFGDLSALSGTGSDSAQLLGPSGLKFDASAGQDSASYNVASGVRFSTDPTLVSLVQAVGHTGGSDPADTLSSVEVLIGTDYADVYDYDGTNAFTPIDLHVAGSVMPTLAGGAGTDVYILNLPAYGSPQNSVISIQDSNAGAIQFVSPASGGTFQMAGYKEVVGGLEYLVLNTDKASGSTVYTGVELVSILKSDLGGSAISTVTMGDVTFDAGKFGNYFAGFSFAQSLYKTVSELQSLIGFMQSGTAGADTLDGGAAGDTLAGGAGDDSYIVNHADDVIAEATGEGTDTALASVSHALEANVENLTLTGSGNINATGNSSVNTIIGNSGNNTLDGGGGSDTLIGGSGDDTYVLHGSEVVSESSGAGSDTVQSDGSVDLASFLNIENIALNGIANANATGNSSVNVLTGNSGSNTLDGSTGADTMLGGVGDDTYNVDNASDIVSENSGEGTDTVFSSVTYTLVANVENLALAGGASINGTGNSLNNTFVGNSGVNTFTGGAGDDTYIIDLSVDNVAESVGEGTDTVMSSVGGFLSANLENLTLTGVGNVNASGNTEANVIRGNSGNNRLDGGLGGTDTLIGGLGDDEYIVRGTDDVVVEDPNGGFDTVYGSNLVLPDNVEKLDVGSGIANGTGKQPKTIFLQPLAVEPLIRWMEAAALTQCLLGTEMTLTLLTTQATS